MIKRPAARSSAISVESPSAMPWPSMAAWIAKEECTKRTMRPCGRFLRLAASSQVSQFGQVGTLAMPVHIQQRVAQQILRVALASQALHQNRAADRNDIFIAEAIGLVGGKISGTEQDRDVVPAGGKLGEADMDIDEDIHIRHLGQEPVETGHQPFRCEGWGRGHAEAGLGRLQLAHRLCDLVESAVHRFLQDLARCGETHRAAGAVEQLHRQLLLELADLMADRGLGHTELRRGVREALEARGGRERRKRAESPN